MPLVPLAHSHARAHTSLTHHSHTWLWFHSSTQSATLSRLLSNSTSRLVTVHPPNPRHVIDDTSSSFVFIPRPGSDGARLHDASSSSSSSCRADLLDLLDLLVSPPPAECSRSAVRRAIELNAAFIVVRQNHTAVVHIDRADQTAKTSRCNKRWSLVPV